jgi:hypothetical protein
MTGTIIDLLQRLLPGISYEKYAEARAIITRLSAYRSLARQIAAQVYNLLYLRVALIDRDICPHLSGHLSRQAYAPYRCCPN